MTAPTVGAGGWGTPTFMGGVPNIGETFVWGRDQQTARDLLDAAEELGIEPHAVRTADNGFIVPTQVWDHVQAARNPDDQTI